jgi:hypothetical protein
VLERDLAGAFVDLLDLAAAAIRMVRFMGVFLVTSR